MTRSLSLRRLTVPMITCNLTCHSYSFHVSQICTGFSLLHQAGEIVLTQQCRQPNFHANKPEHLRDASDAHLSVIVNRAIHLFYDCHDSYEIDEEAASSVHYYFKRSFDPGNIPHSLKAEVFPLGLNYPVFCNEVDSFEDERISAFEPESRDFDPPLSRLTVGELHGLPDRFREPQALFICRTWDPFDVSDPKKTAERFRLNEMRARCIELLRDEFGSCFLGGFMHDDYAVRNYPHLLLTDNEISKKGNYITLLNRYPIGVTTTGLHDSVGWKMGEYVAFSKAIVSERLNYEVPGHFRAGTNYLEFDEPAQCVEAVRELISNNDLRYEMMKSNHEYYLAYLQPDAMVRKTLKMVF
jgi:hypothetical protein